MLWELSKASHIIADRSASVEVNQETNKDKSCSQAQLGSANTKLFQTRKAH
jgi:hypothetical protein